MAIRFIGIDPNTGSGQSPTVWLDEEHDEIILQGWKPGPELEAECAATTLPGHALGIPEGEAIVRIPFRMAQILREACDAAERQKL
jgi:hypothetical protein